MLDFIKFSVCNGVKWIISVWCVQSDAKNAGYDANCQKCNFFEIITKYIHIIKQNLYLH